MSAIATFIQSGGRTRTGAFLSSLALVSMLTATLAGAASGQVVPLPKNSVWKYDTTGVDLGTAWREAGYPDGVWASGPGPLGYGEVYIVTTVPSGPDPDTRYPTTYFRATFEVADEPESIRTVRLSANYDDGFVAYLNGVEIARRQLPAGPISYGTLASSHEGGFYEVAWFEGAPASLVQGTNVLAVEVHQTSLTSSDLVLDMEFAYFTTPPALARGPYLQSGAPTAVAVRWRTDQPAGSRVRVGTEVGSPTATTEDMTPVTEHEIRLTGLSPETLYYYSVEDATSVLAGGDPEHSFVTPPLPGEPRPTRLWIIGDSGTSDANARAVRDAYAAYAGSRRTDLWLMLGDNAYPSGADSSYQTAVFEMYPELLRQTVLWPTRGNHDVVYAGADDYYDIFTLPTGGEAGGVSSGTEAYYSFDHANIHLICLDSEGSNRSPSGAMMTWLASDLAATQRDWVLAFWHHPPYSRGSHNSDDSLDSGGRLRDMRANALPILEAGGVDLVLTGHSHSYERSFLLDGHYGVSSTLTAAMRVDSGDGRPDGDGAYEKPSPGPAPHQGAVYTVAGCSGRLSGGLLNHPVMVSSLNVLGSLVVDIDGLRLDARFLDATGAVRDSFTIVKGTGVAVPGEARPAGRLGLSIAGANPFSTVTRIAFSIPAQGRVRLSILDLNGRRVRTLIDGERPAGAHEASWNGRDDRGRRLGSGVYFGVLEHGGSIEARKLVLTR